MRSLPVTAFLVAQSLLAAVAFAAEGTKWDFERDSSGWRPRSAGITLGRVELAGATDQSHAVLRVEGTQTDGWNYVTSEQRPLQPGGLYRVSFWLEVEKLNPGTPAPFLKCEFVAADPTVQLGRVGTDAYDTARLGQWQKLSVEFRAPDKVVAAWLALEKGTSEPAGLVALLDDVVLEPIARLSAMDRYRLDPLPAPLIAAKGKHPRLFADAASVVRLRQAITTTHAALWTELQAQADGLVKRGAPAYVERDKYSGDEQLWQREVGNAMPHLAMAWLMTGDRKYLQSAQDWALASCGYPTWGLGSIDGKDLAAGHQLLGLATVYDWCHEDLDPAARQTIHDTLRRRGEFMFQAALDGRAWWTKSYLQNHQWVSACGLAAAGLALYDEDEGAALWVGLARDKFRTTMRSLGPDGASHEGVGYWDYGVEYMLKYMTLSHDLLAEDLFGTEWFKQTATYRQYLALPRQAWTRSNCIVDLADCPRGNWYGPDHLLRCLARQYRDGHAQWLAGEIDAANVEAPSARWLNLIWYDPTVTPQPPTDRPTLHHFTDLGLVSARSDWSGNESLVVLKCGPFIGHKAVQEFTYDPGGGHVHPDANHFVVFAQGEWLIRDDGYRAKWTSQHNTLLVDGKGQLGEGQMWFNGAACLAVKARPKILRAESTPELDQLSGDATAAYPAGSGLQRYARHLLFLKPDVLIVVDDLAARGEHALELRFFPESGPFQERDGAYWTQTARATLRVQALTPEGVTVTAGDLPMKGRSGGEDKPLPGLALHQQGAAWRNAVALSWGPATATPVAVTLEQTPTRWTFRAGDRAVQWDWATSQARLLPRP